MSNNEISKFFRTGKAPKELHRVEGTKIPDWPSIANKRRLLNAVDSDSPVVVFDSGRLFTIKHVDSDTVFIKPDGVAVPCGHFTISRLRKELQVHELESV